jgi:hypothetical protein
MTSAQAQQQINLIDKRIDGVRLELFRRVGRFNTFCSWGWQLAWDRNPDLHARQTDLYRQRGELQQIRDAEIECKYQATARRERMVRRKVVVAKFHTVAETTLIRALKDCLIVMAQADAGDTLAAKLARDALASVGEQEEKAVTNFGLAA